MSSLSSNLSNSLDVCRVSVSRPQVCVQVSDDLGLGLGRTFLSPQFSGSPSRERFTGCSPQRISGHRCPRLPSASAPGSRNSERNRPVPDPSKKNDLRSESSRVRGLRRSPGPRPQKGGPLSRPEKVSRGRGTVRETRRKTLGEGISVVFL